MQVIKFGFYINIGNCIDFFPLKLHVEVVQHINGLIEKDLENMLWRLGT